jgi:hypothetical protein
MQQNHLSPERSLYMVAKRILCSERLRRVPKRFSWVDHRLVRDKHICDLSHPSLALYLFLVTVSDADGLSYYSDGVIRNYLHLTDCLLSQARAELCSAGLIVYSRPLYQVLSLDGESQLRGTAEPLANPAVRGKSDPLSIGDILRQAIGGAK